MTTRQTPLGELRTIPTAAEFDEMRATILDLRQTVAHQHDLIARLQQDMRDIKTVFENISEVTNRAYKGEK